MPQASHNGILMLDVVREVNGLKLRDQVLTKVGGWVGGWMGGWVGGWVGGWASE